MSSTGRAVIAKTVADGLARVLGLITFPILARLEGPGGYGAYAQLMTLVGFAAPLATFGLSNTMVRFFSGRAWTTRRAHTAGRVLLIGAVGALAISLLGVFFAPEINDAFLRWPNGTSLFRSGAILVFITGVDLIVLDLLRARGMLLGFSAFQVGQSFVTVIAVTLALWLDLGVVGFVQILVVGRVAALIVPLARSFGGVIDDQNDEPQHAQLSRLLRFGLPLTVASLGLWMTNLGDRLIIGRSLSPDELGRYAAAYTIALLVPGAAAGIHLAAYPRIVAVAQNAPHLLSSQVRVFQRFAALASVPVAALLAITGRNLVNLIGGSGFELAIAVPALLAIALLLDQVNGVAHYVLMSFDRTTWLQGAWLFAGAANLAINVLAVPAWGLIGAAITTLATFAALETAVFRQASLHVRLDRAYDWSHLGRTLSAAAVAGLTASPLLLGEVAWARQIGGVAVFSVTFAVVGILTRAIARDDIRRFLTAIRTRGIGPT